MFNTCESKFNGRAEVAQPDGNLVNWNLVESYALDDCGVSPANTQWYKRATATTSNYFGWGKKDGKSNHASAYLRFTDASGSWAWIVKSQSCG